MANGKVTAGATPVTLAECSLGQGVSPRLAEAVRHVPRNGGKIPGDWTGNYFGGQPEGPEHGTGVETTPYANY